MRAIEAIGNKEKRCRYCKTVEHLTIDHKKPLSKGGLTEKRNLQYLCYRCNTVKSNMSHKQFLHLMIHIKNILNSREKWKEKFLKERK